MASKRRKKPKIKKFYQVNQYIKSPKLRVVDEKATQIGVLSLKEALDLAEERGLDLVEVAPKAVPPVAKIIDFAKFKYQLKQKLSSGAKKSKAQDIKEIRFTPFIAENDYSIRIKKALEFLEDGDKVKLVVKFVGRQITRKDFGKALMKKAIKALSEESTVEREPAFQGKLLISTLNPIKKK